MFADLIKIWRQQAFTAQVIDEFVSMLSISEEMLSYTFRVLLGEIPPDEFAENIYRKDQSINFREQDIRKRILVHLSTDQRSNLAESLALISVAKDAERLGDYVKNIFELQQKLASKSDCDREMFTILFDQTGREVIALFREAALAFKDSDAERAATVVRNGRDIGRRCEDFIGDIVESNYTARKAVILALGARYLKRIALHLANIASSVVNPLPEKDYRQS